LGSAAALAAVATVARADDVLPGGEPTTGARHDVVEVELGAGEPLAAILASVPVARVDVVAADPDVAHRSAVERDQQDHARDEHGRGVKEDCFAGRILARSPRWLYCRSPGLSSDVANLILINSTPEETRVALVENGALAEIHIERARDRGIVGNIYKGKVVRVL